MKLDENSVQEMYFRTGVNCRRWDPEEICHIDSCFLSPFSLPFFFFFPLFDFCPFYLCQWMEQWMECKTTFFSGKKKKNPILFILHF